MEPLSEKKKKKLEKVLDLTLNGEEAFIETLLDLADRIENLEERKPASPEKGDPGKPYVPTREDFQAIASLVNVPVVDRVIEKTTEIIREQPIIKTEIVKETIEKQPMFTTVTQKIEVPLVPQQIVDNLNKIEGLVEPTVIRGWKDFERMIRANAEVPPKGFDFRIGVSQTDLQTLARRVTVLETTGTGGSSTGFQQVSSGVVNGSNTAFTWVTAPNVIVVDGVPRQKTQSDGTVNWTGTTTTTLSIAPNFDIFATS